MWNGGGTSSLAWRTLDAQYWGVPQRRKRIFLVADFDGRSAAEILFVEQGLHGDSSESEGEGQEIATNVGESIDSASETLTPWDVQSNRIQSINGKAATLYGGAGQGTHNGAIFDTRQIDTASGFKYRQGAKAGNIGYQNGKAPTLELSQNCAIHLQPKDVNSSEGGYTIGALQARDYKGVCNQWLAENKLILCSPLTEPPLTKAETHNTTSK